MRQRSRGERPAVEHHELARRREDGVDHHQDEDGDDAVVGEPRSHGASLTAKRERNRELRRPDGARHEDVRHVRSRRKLSCPAAAVRPSRAGCAPLWRFAAGRSRTTTPAPRLDPQTHPRGPRQREPIVTALSRASDATPRPVSRPVVAERARRRPTTGRGRRSPARASARPLRRRTREGRRIDARARARRRSRAHAGRRRDRPARL